MTEAGGVVSDLMGRAFGWSGEGILASNATLHSSLMPFVSAAVEARHGI